MTERPVQEAKAEEDKQAIVQANRERRVILDGLRDLVSAAQAVERRVVAGYVRADQERRK